MRLLASLQIHPGKPLVCVACSVPQLSTPQCACDNFTRKHNHERTVIQCKNSQEQSSARYLLYPWRKLQAQMRICLLQQNGWISSFCSLARMSKTVGVQSANQKPKVNSQWENKLLNIDLTHKNKLLSKTEVQNIFEQISRRHLTMKMQRDPHNLKSNVHVLVCSTSNEQKHQKQVLSRNTFPIDKRSFQPALLSNGQRMLPSQRMLLQGLISHQSLGSVS